LLVFTSIFIVIGLVSTLLLLTRKTTTPKEVKPSAPTTSIFATMVEKSIKYPYQDKQNDLKRRLDVELVAKAINIAMEEGEIKLVDTVDCINCTSDKGTNSLDGQSGWVKFQIVSGKQGLKKYIKELPSDPINKGKYVYSFASNRNTFEINTVLESEDKLSTDHMKNDGGNNPSIYELGNSVSLLK
jgi:hypothetical protein